MFCHQFPIDNGIVLTGTGADQVITQAFAASANPGAEPSGHADDQRKWCHIAGDHGARRNHGIRTDCRSTDDGCIGADAGSAFHKCRPELFLAIDEGSGRKDIGKDCAWPAKHLVFKPDAFIDRDVVLNLAAVADVHIRADHDVLTYHAFRTDVAAG